MSCRKDVILHATCWESSANSWNHAKFERATGTRTWRPRKHRQIFKIRFCHLNRLFGILKAQIVPQDSSKTHSENFSTKSNREMQKGTEVSILWLWTLFGTGSCPNSGDSRDWILFRCAMDPCSAAMFVLLESQALVNMNRYYTCSLCDVGGNCLANLLTIHQTKTCCKKPTTANPTMMWGYFDLELVVGVRQCPLRAGARSSGKEEGGTGRRGEVTLIKSRDFHLALTWQVGNNGGYFRQRIWVGRVTAHC